MSQIINGTTANVISQTKPVMFVDMNGYEIHTGLAVCTGSVAYVLSQVTPILFVDQSGNSLT